MTSQGPGRDISEVEVTNISRHGIWVFVEDTEYFLPQEMFPWFKNARLSEILDVELLHDFHLHWPKLDIDLDLASLENPTRFPLVYSDHTDKL